MTMLEQWLARLSGPSHGLRSLFLALLCLAAFAPGIAALPPTDRDESRFVQATKQMAETGDYLDIRFQDVPRYKKPIGIYWLQSAALKLTGADPQTDVWAYRLASLAGGIVAVLGTAWLGTILFGGSRRAGFRHTDGGRFHAVFRSAHRQDRRRAAGKLRAGASGAGARLSGRRMTKPVTAHGCCSGWRLALASSSKARSRRFWR